jgi:serine/threonine protein kinase
VEFIPRTTLGSFEIAARLDQGGMADVFLGVRQGTNSVVVIKVLLEKWKSRQEMHRLFRDEGRFMARICHPNVVQVVEHGEVQGRPFIAMEYLAGDDLALIQHRLRDDGRKMPFGLIGLIAEMAADGLAAVHEATDENGRPLGLVHRDLSPQNILLCYNGAVKLLDFGIALAADQGDPSGGGLLKGKIPYMSPEQVRRQALDGRSDIFSLGIVLWEMIAGQDLFDQDSNLEIMKAIAGQVVPPPSEVRSGAPRELDQIVLRCLERDPPKRFQSALDLKRALGDFRCSRVGRYSADQLQEFIHKVLGDRVREKEAQRAQLEREKGAGSDDLAEGDPGLMLRQALQSGEAAKAIGAYRLLVAGGHQPNLDLALAIRLAEALEYAGLYLDAARVCRQGAEKDLKSPLAPQALLKGGTLLIGPAAKPKIGVDMLRFLIQTYPNCPQAELAHGVLKRHDDRSSPGRKGTP